MSALPLSGIRQPSGFRLILIAWLVVLFALSPAYGQRKPPTPDELQGLNLSIESDPNLASNYVDRGWAYAQLGNESSARKDYAKALALKPGSPRALWSFGWALFDLGHPAEALTIWKECSAKEKTIFLSDEDLNWTTYTFALAYWSLGQKKLAFDSYTQAAEKIPNHFRSRKALLKYTDFWTAHDRAIISELFDAWATRAEK